MVSPVAPALGREGKLTLFVLALLTGLALRQTRLLRARLQLRRA